jgi:single-strand DNA-binding protein
MQIKGIINAIFEIETVGDKGFQKRQFWLDVKDGTYTQTIALEFVKDNTSKLDNLRAGDTVEVEFNLKGRIWQTRCFNTLEAWRITKDGTTSHLPPAAPVQSKPIVLDSMDDLPF